jgi:hypothetical protein
MEKITNKIQYGLRFRTNWAVIYGVRTFELYLVNFDNFHIPEGHAWNRNNLKYGFYFSFDFRMPFGFIPGRFPKMYWMGWPKIYNVTLI